jgi:hypothetical protein
VAFGIRLSRVQRQPSTPQASASWPDLPSDRLHHTLVDRQIPEPRFSTGHLQERTSEYRDAEEAGLQELVIDPEPLWRWTRKERDGKRAEGDKTGAERRA